MGYDPTKYPYDTVAYVYATFGGQTVQGSGVLVSPDEVLTAAHVVYLTGVGSASTITVSPGYSGTTSQYGTIAATYVHYLTINDAGDLITLQQSQSDFAVIHLSRPVTGAGYMGLDPNFGGGAVSITGYPASANGVQINSTQTASIDPSYSLLDFSTLGKGSSGGPLWTTSAGGPQVVGVVSSSSGSSGYGGLITTAIFNQIQTWVSADDSGTSSADLLPISPTTVGVFRFFDTTDGGHFFTTSVREESSVAGAGELKSEGVGFGAVSPTASDPRASPVYRFFETTDGGHFFTTSAAERDNAIATRPDLTYEGIAFNEHTAQQSGDVAVYRFFDTGSGGHFFTANVTEKNSVLATSQTLKYEGIAFYSPSLS